MIIFANNPDRIGILKCWFLRRGENRSTWRKTSRSKEDNQQQTQPTYDAGSRNQTQDTLVGGEHSHHCAIRAPLTIVIDFFSSHVQVIYLMLSVKLLFFVSSIH